MSKSSLNTLVSPSLIIFSLPPYSLNYDEDKAEKSTLRLPQAESHGFHSTRAQAEGLRVAPALRWTQGLELVERPFDLFMQVALR